MKSDCWIVRAPPALVISRALAVWWSSVAAAKGNQDRRPARGGQLGDGRGAGAADHQMRVGELVGHVLDVGQELGGDAELGIALADPLDIVGAALLDDLQPAAERRLEQAEAVGHDLAEHGRALASAGDEDLERRDLVERRERQLAEPRDLRADRIADQHRLAAISWASAARPRHRRCRSPRPRRRAGG